MNSNIPILTTRRKSTKNQQASQYPPATHKTIKEGTRRDETRNARFAIRMPRQGIDWTEMTLDTTNFIFEDLVEEPDFEFALFG